MVDKILVYYHTRLVGTICCNLDNHKYYFSYSEQWLENGFSISPFSLPLKNKVFEPISTIFNGLFGVFADSMPDAWGRLLLDRYMHQNNSKEDINELLRLAYVDENGMGALEYIPTYKSEVINVFPNLDDFQEKANLILDNKAVNVEELFKYAGSSGGARPKALIRYNNESWIVKFQYKYDMPNAGKMEYDYALACKKIGIDIPEVHLFEGKYFGVKRFDRENNQKKHMISAAALLEVDYKSPCLDYDALFKLTRILTNDNMSDIENLYLRMCFNVYAHNLDDHAKNFSFLYDEESKMYRLSPAYDMTYSNTYYGEHTTSVNKKGKDISSLDLISLGVKHGIKKEKGIILLNRVIKIIEEDLSAYL